MIEEFAKNVPNQFLKKSGSVFYSGRKAFSKRAELYILGLNPAGDPQEQAEETIEWHSRKVLQCESDDWSAYRDESWKKKLPGKWGMQPRVLHLFNRLNLPAGEVPASNVIFLRSRREKYIAGNINYLANECWPFHQMVLDALKPKAILCFGKRAGELVQKRVGATKQIDEFIEMNKRQWHSQAFQSSEGMKVIVATHPSVANWCVPSSDPTMMILRVMNL